ncbi:amidase [Pseudobacillus wudalianchiensis]|uniref:Amidase n=1 Tax=Pseudobacillus wudalianchiensis TaxID=1743143 RepID=A0A1B9AU03_9BACI|nr:amidase [Bacillus wudalianchiensis]OCA87168.1 amidase [Bacillus wudalianchiensis]
MKFSEYSIYDAVGLAELVKKKEVTPKELAEAAFKGIEKVNPAINAVVQILDKQVDKEIERGLHDGPFTGVPFLIKELGIQAAGVSISSGSRLLAGLVTPTDDELMTRFRKSGLLTVGTTTTPEFGYNFTTESVLHGPTRNPWNIERSAGGSSGGSAAAVAAGIVPIAHANDGAGSVRVPASYNGLIGFKPTRGRVPTGPNTSEPAYGRSSSFAITRSVRDTAALLDCVSGPDVGCYAWAERPKLPYKEEALRAPGRLRIAWSAQPQNQAPVNEEVVRVLHQTVKLCEELGHEVIEAAPVVDEEWHSLAALRIKAAYTTAAINKASARLKRTPSEENLETAIWSAYQIGQSLKAAELLEAFDIQNRISRSVGEFFTHYDVLLTPTAAQLPPVIGELNMDAPDSDMKGFGKKIFRYFPFTRLFNTTGQPAVSLPLGWSASGLPIGMQFAGRFADEATLFRLAGQLEEACSWNTKTPINVGALITK